MTSLIPRPLTPVFETYWRFAANRQALYLSRLAEEPRELWTDDPILAKYRWTNVYRAADRVSQYLIRHVIYGGPQNEEDIVFRTLLFKLFNKIETWELLRDKFGEPTWKKFHVPDYSIVLAEAMAKGTPVYSAAYVMPPVQLGAFTKATNHLRLLQVMMLSGLPATIVKSPSLKEVYRQLRRMPGIGDFLAYQYAIDLNYSEIIDFDEMDFVVAGPGARSGMRKCFSHLSREEEIRVIHECAEHQDHYFAELGLEFPRLGRSRPLQLIDCQGLFCETDKYARVAHPDVIGTGDRTKIKQNYRPSSRPLERPFFPPKWSISWE